MISVIIPTRNRADLLSSALQSLTRQTLSRHHFEILVIDNGSSDSTASVVKEHSTILSNLRYFYEPEPGLHVGRHRGMLAAKGDILVFIDDDIEAFPIWLETICKVFSEPNVALLGGNNVPLFLSPPPQWLTYLWNRSSGKKIRAFAPLSILEVSGGAREFDPLYVWGCNFSIRKEVLLTAGGFHPDGMPQELIRYRGDGESHVSHCIKRAGLRCVFDPEASVYHKVTPERMTFAYFRQRGFNQGVSDSYTELRDRDSNARARKHTILFGLGKSCWRHIKNLLPFNAEAKLALCEMETGRKEGYAYHQKMYRDDAEVRAWTHKTKYFDEDCT